MIKELIRRVWYNPYRFARKNPHIQIGDSKLTKSFTVDFRTIRNGISFRIGSDCILGCSVIFESAGGTVTIGDRVFINSGTALISRSEIVIENDVTIAWGCTIYDHDSHSSDCLHRRADQRQQLVDWADGNFIRSKDWSTVATAPIRICRDAWLGFDVVVLKGVTIGEGAIVGAGSVVTKDVPAWTIAAGNPARVVRHLPEHLRRPSEPA